MQEAGKILVILFLVPILGISQQRDSLAPKKDTVSFRGDTSRQKSIIMDDPRKVVSEGAKLDFRSYFTLLADNFKQQFTAPFHWRKKEWLKVGSFTLLTGVVSFANKPVNRFAVKLHNESRTVATVSRYVTDFGGAYEVYALAGFYAYGLIFKTKKEKTTTLLATQAYITAGVLSSAGKRLFGVQRPYYTDPNTNTISPVFRGPIYPLTNGVDASSYTSFPSGHTTAAFAAATVYAIEYRDKPLIPIFSYSVATLIGLSRITENKHWPTDVLAGAVLGYLSGRQVVKNYHRYAKFNSRDGHKQPVLLTFQYHNKQFLSGLVYRL